MSDPVEKKEQRELATNRLLDLLRAKQSGAPVGGEEKPTILKKIAEDKEIESSQEKKIEPVQETDEIVDKPRGGESLLESLSKQTITAEPDYTTATYKEEKKDEKTIRILKPEIPEKSDEDESKAQLEDEPPSVMKKIGDAGNVSEQEPQSTDLLHLVKSKIPEKKETPVIKPGIDVKKPSEPSIDVTEKKEPVSEIDIKGITDKIPRDLLHQIQTTSSESVKGGEEIIAEEFDSSLFSVLSGKSQKPSINDYKRFVFRYLNESRNRVSIYYRENYVRLLKIRLTLKEFIIEKAVTYHLPYKTEEHIINDIDELLLYVLEHEIDVSQRKSLYSSLFSQVFNVRTKIIHTPQLKKSELSELVEWNIKKNLPFNPDQAVVNWESFVTVGDENKQSVVIGVGMNSQLEDVIAKFKDLKIKLRLFSTLPILMWKLFIRNYPDRKEGTYVLVHIGEINTTVVVVIDHKLVFNREIVIGARDFYQAVQQKIMVNGKPVEVDHRQARKILHTYGIPNNPTGVIPGSKISLYKLSIFLRPAVERLNNELVRSKNYFKKQNPDVEWNWMLIDGIGATIPNLPHKINESLDIEIELTNPLRVGRFSFSDNAILPDNMIPAYAINFALAAEESEKINVLPKSVLASYKFIFLSKFAASLVAFFIPFFIMSNIITNMRIDSMTEKIATQTSQWNRLSAQSKEYFDLIDDIDILNAYQIYLKNDRIFSWNQIKILKILSATITENIKLTSMVFTKEVTDGDIGNASPNLYMDILDIIGFVQSDPSVADIQLTNFVIKLEQLNVFSKVDMKIEEQTDTQDWKLIFTLKLGL